MPETPDRKHMMFGLAMPKPDRKHVIFSLYPDGLERKIGTFGASTVFKPTVYHMPPEAFHDYARVPVGYYMAGALEDHIRKYGAIDELVIGAHGNTESMRARDENGSSPERQALYLRDALDVVAELEKTFGRPMIKRIVFSGCGTFSHLDDKAIAHYRQFAKEHHIEVVGSTSSTWATKAGRYVQFTPTGEVVRDVLDSPVYMALNQLGDEDHSWADAFLNRTQEAGKKAWRADMVARVRAFVGMKARSPFDAQIGPDAVVREELLHMAAREPSVQVSIAEDRSCAVILQSDGVVQSAGNISLRPMTAEEKRHLRVEKAHDQFMVLSDTKNPADPISCILMDDKKHVLAATQDGRYAVLDINHNGLDGPLATSGTKPPLTRQK
jgi:predicted Zn-dependent protease with MMP-like domain